MPILILDEKDLVAVEEIAVQTWPQTYSQILSAEQLNYMLKSFYALPVLKSRMGNGSLFHLFVENGFKLGFSEIKFNEKENMTKLHKLYVLPETQGKSVGKRLMRHAIAMAKDAKQNGIYLNVNRFNNAKLFYEKLGFEVQSQEDIDIGQGFYMNDYVMQLNFE